MNVGLATNPHEIDPQLEDFDNWHAAAAHDLSRLDGASDWAGTCNSTRCVHHIELNVEHGLNEQDTKLELARRLEELAAGLRES